MPISDDINAIGQGLFHGYDTTATPLLKAGAQVGVLNLDPAAIQGTYNQNTANYNQAAQQHPYLAGAGNLIGSIGASAPLFAVGGAGVAANVIRGAVMGGLSSYQGQDPNQVISPSGAATGALVGGAAAGISNSLTNLGTKGADKVAEMLGWSPSTVTNTMTNSGNVDLDYLSKNVQALDSADTVAQNTQQAHNLTAMQGLHSIMQHSTGAAIGAGIGGYEDGEKGAYAGAAIGAGIQASPTAIQKILSSKALTTVLNTANSVDPSMFKNPSFTQFMTNRVSQLLTNAGITKYAPSGQPPALIHQDELPAKQNNIYNSFDASDFQAPTTRAPAPVASTPAPQDNTSLYNSFDTSK